MRDVFFVTFRSCLIKERRGRAAYYQARKNYFSWREEVKTKCAAFPWKPPV
ncbi:MAG: hypothetical protein M3R14_14105 [Acidobacteriota bacterium]|nr:hypothetical protein [Acidobacteriota bacterium]